RPLSFHGQFLFVNADVKAGELRAEILDRDGQPIAPFSRDQCMPLKVDGTRQRLRWQGSSSLTELAGKPVRFRFSVTHGKLYAFWVSPDQSGASRGYVAAGGPGFSGPTDTVGG